MEVRKASISEAAEICGGVRASISELCFADHKEDPELLKSWLANKTPENVARWLSNPSNINLIVVEDGAILMTTDAEAA
jgi:hypothetical protein